MSDVQLEEAVQVLVEEFKKLGPDVQVARRTIGKSDWVDYTVRGSGDDKICCLCRNYSIMPQHCAKESTLHGLGSHPR